MTRKNIASLAVAIFVGVGLTEAQRADPFDAPNITDEMTRDADQNAQWRLGQNKYPSKPRHMWELGIHAGHAFISGDVEAVAPSGYGVGLSVRRALNYVLSVRVSGQYTTAKGFDARPMSFAVFKNERTYQQLSSAEKTLLSVYEGGHIHRNYKTSTIAGTVDVILNVGNILFHQPRNKWNGYLAVGLGVNAPTVEVNLLNGTAAYNFASVTQGLDLDKLSDRKTARKRLKDLLDSDYETPGGVEKNIAKFGDDKSVLYHISFALGVAHKLSQRVNLGIEHQVLWSDSDLWDGFEYRSTVDKTNNQDLHHYTSLRLGINLGNFEKATEPLYWLNPLDAPYSDIAELKQRPKFDLTDSDGDGVIDLIDQEPNTPPGCPVDTRGVMLDSDGDGIPDCYDKEPFSPPGYPVDEHGVAIIPDPGYLTEEQIVELITTRTVGMMDWFLPMVHFDLDKYYIKPEFYGQLHHVATVLNMHPSVKVVVHGHTDNRSSSVYNNVLSYNRANAVINYLVDRYNLPRERLILQWGGQENALIEGLPDNHNTTFEQEQKHYMNRRVEFRIAKPGDDEMSRPEGPEAGEATPGSSRPGTKYSGNRSAGY